MVVSHNFSLFYFYFNGVQSASLCATRHGSSKYYENIFVTWIALSIHVLLYVILPKIEWLFLFLSLSFFLGRQHFSLGCPSRNGVSIWHQRHRNGLFIFWKWRRRWCSFVMLCRLFVASFFYFFLLPKQCANDIKFPPGASSARAQLNVNHKQSVCVCPCFLLLRSRVFKSSIVFFRFRHDDAPPQF